MASTGDAMQSDSGRVVDEPGTQKRKLSATPSTFAGVDDLDDETQFSQSSALLIPLGDDSGKDNTSRSNQFEEIHWELPLRSPISVATDPSTSIASDSALQNRRRRYQSMARLEDPIEEESDNLRVGLRNRLDASMAAVRRWLKGRADRSLSHSGASESMDMHFCPDDTEQVRHRTLSESDATRIFPTSPSTLRRRRAFTEDTPLSPTAAAALYSPARNSNSSNPSNTAVELMHADFNIPNATGVSLGSGSNTGRPETTTNNPTTPSSNQRLNSRPATTEAISHEQDPEWRARIRWIRINRRFQIVITVVALIFTLLLFSILVGWVVFTSAYVVSFDKSCDVPLKPYFWLVTLQLILDVFRSDIMRLVFHWDANSNQRIPCRVIAYNVVYLVYAMLVLRLGVRSVFFEDGSTCRKSAPELYNASVAFVSLSIAAWATILFGYLLPFCIVAAMLTCNGYNPVTGNTNSTSAQPVFPAAYANTGAPPTCIESLPTLTVDEFSTEYPRECCICMEEFRRTDVVVETPCKHIFHKLCCREWLLQARSCPICRLDIPANLNLPDGTIESHSTAAHIPLGPTGRPVVGLLRMLNQPDNISYRSTNSHRGSWNRPTAPGPLRARTASVPEPPTG